MNRTKLLPKLAILIAIGFLVFSFIPTVQAGVPPFIDRDLDDPQGIFWWKVSEISASKESWFRAGIANFPEELENNWAPKNPYKIRLYINGVEIELRRYAYVDRAYKVLLPERDEYNNWVYENIEPIITKLHVWYWYAIFEPGYFQSDTYPYTIEFKTEVWVYEPYGGSEEKRWRIFVNYEGPEYYQPAYPEAPFYREIGFPHIFYQDLTVNE